MDIGISFPFVPFSGGKNGGSCSEICGDGISLGRMQCDDGNIIDGDGCSSSCSIETGFTCENDGYLSRSICKDIKGPSFTIESFSQAKTLVLHSDQETFTHKTYLTD